MRDPAALNDKILESPLSGVSSLIVAAKAVAVLSRKLSWIKVPPFGSIVAIEGGR